MHQWILFLTRGIAILDCSNVDHFVTTKGARGGATVLKVGGAILRPERAKKKF